jgi:hypothetical protein
MFAETCSLGPSPLGFPSGIWPLSSPGPESAAVFQTQSTCLSCTYTCLVERFLSCSRPYRVSAGKSIGSPGWWNCFDSVNTWENLWPRKTRLLLIAGSEAWDAYNRPLFVESWEHEGLIPVPGPLLGPVLKTWLASDQLANYLCCNDQPA